MRLRRASRQTKTAREDYPAAFIASAFRQGLTATEALRAFRAPAVGGRIRTQTWFQLAGEVKALQALRPIVAAAPLHRRPDASEVTTLTTRRARGVAYQVSIHTRERGTSFTLERPIRVTFPALVSYGRALDKAVQIYEDEVADQYNEVVYGATVVGVAEMVPGLE